MSKPNRRDKVDLLLKLSIAVMFITGFLIFMYPFIVDSINNYIDQQRLEEVQDKMEARSEADKKKRLEKLEKENKKLKTIIPGAGSFEDPFETSLRGTKSPKKEYFEEHMIGAIFIPKIKVSLPVYDETNDFLLDKGATVLQGTSFPVGGKSTHSVLTGHTGLPEKKLFTDLESLQKKDRFFLHIEGKKLAYQVDRIKVVEPDGFDALKIEKNRDIVTLLTCTPYGVNSHRLLVTGHRVAYPVEAAKKIKETEKYHRRRVYYLAAGCLFFILLFGYFVWRKVILYQSKKRNYNFVFYLYENGEPLPGVRALLTQKNDVVRFEGKLVHTVSDRFGKIEFQQIPGGVYRVETENGLSVKGKIWRLKDQKFKIIKHRSYKNIKQKITHFIIESKVK
ncbi:class C sortase [Enterococcus pseudoavium]|uniref:Class C sortase n=1 Tax=Enterococcus pseudoavium TaxID=44007 RepID=A0ABU3FHG3_9ENTE|nr:class C sortase [Enterococcus pseudoavium]MDT2754902.1 class C sortase [Enterococcus pseudoavium]MDT2770279.1 class C sortase [Enterococcus pseudoavium]REC33302.1 class C sortase [Enterococcus pseudoavium]